MPTSLHGAVQIVLSVLLLRLGWKVASEVTLKLVPDAEPVPDLVASRDKIERPYPTKPIELCVEILSPEDRLNKIIRKARYYLDWGVQYVWIVDPAARTAWIVTPEHPDGVPIQLEGALTAGPDTTIPLSEAFAEVDKLV
jgi:Uma2 family endonuclease